MLDRAIIKKLSEIDLMALREFDKTGTGKVLMKVSAMKREIERKALEVNPRRDDANLRNDYVYKLGLIAGLGVLEDLAAEVEEIFRRRDAK